MFIGQLYVPNQCTLADPSYLLTKEVSIECGAVTTNTDVHHGKVAQILNSTRRETVSINRTSLDDFDIRIGLVLDIAGKAVAFGGQGSVDV